MPQIDYRLEQLTFVMMMHLENDQEKILVYLIDLVLLFVAETLFVAAVMACLEKLISLIVSKAIQTMLT